MRIAYVGNFRHPFCTEVHLAATLEDLGHTVLQIQEDEHPAAAVFDLARDKDLLLYTRTWGFPDGPAAGLDLMTRLATAGVVTASYHLDLYFGLKRQRTLRGDPFWATQYVFTPDGGHQTQFEQLGINHHYIRPGVYRAECTRGRPRNGFVHDVVFVGSYTYHPEWPYRRQLIDRLRATYGNRFALYGEGDTVRGRDLNDLYASAKVVVGDSLCLGFRQPYYWSDRIYETIGRGGFLIHPEIIGLDEEFTDRETAVFYRYGDFNQLYSLVDHYLAHPEERRVISSAGQDFVRDHCSYHDRLTQALAVIEKQA